MAQKNCGCGQDPCITFGAETMTKSQAKKKFVTLAQPYWIKELTELKQSFMTPNLKLMLKM